MFGNGIPGAPGAAICGGAAPSDGAPGGGIIGICGMGMPARGICGIWGCGGGAETFISACVMLLR
jgi:hypothetical protein